MLPLRILGQDPPIVPLPSQPPAWLGYGFRPFFLGASLLAPFPVIFWLLSLFGLVGWPPALPAVYWHGHEMVFGFSASVIAGFLLTAVPNWTGQPTPRGYPLGGLFLVWFSARLAILVPETTWLFPAALLDLAFFPLLAATLAFPLRHSMRPAAEPKKGDSAARNLIFLPVLLALAATNALYWAGALGIFPGGLALGLELGVGLVLVLISIIAGRVVPFFARGPLKPFEPVSRGWVELAATPLLALTVLASAAQLPSPLQLVLCSATALIHLLRLFGWYAVRIWSVPLLWILYVGYAFLGLGFAVKTLSLLGVCSAGLALHAHTVGCIGVMIFGMMARVALGHSGRELKPAISTVAGFWCITAAALLRALVPIALPQTFRYCLILSAVLWSVAFLLFAKNYFPILVTPRADGKPG